MISSVHNPKLKFLNRIRQRKEEKLILVEGLREVSVALSCHLKLISLFVCPEVLSEEARRFLREKVDPVFCGESFEVSAICYEKIAVRGQSDGIIGVFEEPSFSLSDFSLKEKASFVVAENLEKPGNLGAILRTADACGATGIILLGRSVDCFNPNVIRASLGAVFTVPIVSTSSDEWFAFSKAHMIKNYGAIISSTSHHFNRVSYGARSAVVLGSEAHGLSSEVMKRCDEHVIIPMIGRVNSLNVSVAAGILMYHIGLDS